MKENAEQRSRRYLCDGRLIISRIDDNRIVATCRGSGAVYDVLWSAGGGWRCTCPARSVCSHIVALQLVTVVGRMAR